MTSAKSQPVKLTDTQLVTLSAAAQREDHRVTAPGHLKGAIAQRLLATLQSKGLIAVDGEDGEAYLLTELAFQVLGIEVPSADGGAILIGDSSLNGDSGDRGEYAEAAVAYKAPRQGSKLHTVVTMLSAPAGATIDELMATTGWLPHTTRAALTGLRKRGIAVELRKGKDGEAARYRVPQPPASAPDEVAITEKAA